MALHDEVCKNGKTADSASSTETLKKFAELRRSQIIEAAEAHVIIDGKKLEVLYELVDVAEDLLDVCKKNDCVAGGFGKEINKCIESIVTAILIAPETILVVAHALTEFNVGIVKNTLHDLGRVMNEFESATEPTTLSADAPINGCGEILLAELESVKP